MTTSPKETFDWCQYAVCYDRLLDLKPYTSMLHEIVENILTGPHTSILDASCGTGNLETFLNSIEVSGPIAVTGVDSSVEMLARAKQKLSTANNQQITYRFNETDLNSRLPFEDSTFECVVSLNTLYAVKSPKVTLSEFYRVLKKGGRLLLVTPKTGYENGIILREHIGDNSPIEDWIDAHASPEKEERLIRRALSNEDAIKDMLVVAHHNRHIAQNHEFHFFDEKELVNLLEEVGYFVAHLSCTYANQDFFTIATKGI